MNKCLQRHTVIVPYKVRARLAKFPSFTVCPYYYHDPDAEPAKNLTETYLVRAGEKARHLVLGVVQTLGPLPK